MRLGLLLAFCSKYSVALALSVTNNSPEGAAAAVEWWPAAAVCGYWCAALLLLLLLLATCAARSRRRDADGDGDGDGDADAYRGDGAGRGLCDRLAHCWPWSPHVIDSPLASQIQLGRARYSLDRRSLRYEQLVENNYVFFRAVPLDALWEGRGDEITEKEPLAQDYDEKLEKTDDGEHEELASHGHEEVAVRGLEEMASHGYEEPVSNEPEELASQAREELASQAREELASQASEELADQAREELASQEREELAGQGREELVSQGREELAKRGKDVLTFREQEEMASRGYEKLVSDEHAELASNGRAKLIGDEPEVLVNSVIQEAVDRVWATAARRNLRPQEVRSEPLPLPLPESGDSRYILEDVIVPAVVKAEKSSHGHMSETETPPPFGTPEDRHISAFASKQPSVTFSDTLRHIKKKVTDEGGSKTRTAAAGKAGDRTVPCPYTRPEAHCRRGRR